MLTERTFLHGNNTERIFQALKKAGWFDGRRADISLVLDYYQKRGIVLNSKAI